MNNTAINAIYDLFADPNTDYKAIVLKIAKTNPEYLFNIINSNGTLYSIVNQYAPNKIEAIKAVRSQVQIHTGKRSSLVSTKQFVEDVFEKGYSNVKLELLDN